MNRETRRRISHGRDGAGTPTLRQSVAPPHLLGRVNAAIQLASRGMLPIGALAGGYLGGKIGIVNTLWIGAAGIFLSTLWLLPFIRSNVRSEA